MSYSVVLVDVENNQILPVTLAENVFVSGSETLKETLERIASQGSGGAYVLPVASENKLGGIKVGAGLEITEDGTLNCVVSGRSAGQSSTTFGRYGSVGIGNIATYEEV